MGVWWRKEWRRKGEKEGYERGVVQLDGEVEDVTVVIGRI